MKVIQLSPPATVRGVAGVALLVFLGAGGSLAPITASAVNDDATNDDATVVVAVSGTLNATFDSLLVPGLTPLTSGQVAPGHVPDRTLCDAQGGVYAPGPTEIFYSGTSKYTGTFEGTGRFCGHVNSGIVQPDRPVPFIETDTFTGTVRGCGTGSVTYSARGFVSSQFSPAKQGFPAQEDWLIFPRGGTAGLRGISGGGHNEATVSLKADDAGTFMGSVTCVPTSPPDASKAGGASKSGDAPKASGASKTSATAAARKENGDTTVAVHGDLSAVFDLPYLQPGLAPSGSELCKARGGAYAPGPADLVYSGHGTYSPGAQSAGGLSGTLKYCGHTTPGVVRPDGSVLLIETDTFTGTVEGCGTGTIMFDAMVTVYPGAPSAQGVPGHVDWQILAGSGTAGLSGLHSGSGTEDGWIHPVNQTFGDDAHLVGSVDCAPPSGKSASTSARGPRNNSDASARVAHLPNTSAAGAPGNPEGHSTQLLSGVAVCVLLLATVVRQLARL